MLKDSKMFLLFLSFITVYSAAVNAEAQVIEVSGEGVIEVAPNNFTLSLTVSERGRVPDKLKASVDKRSNMVLNAAKSLGVKESDINSARVNLRVVEEKPAIELHGVEVKHKFPSTNSKPLKGSVYIDGNEISTQKYEKQKPTLFELSRRVTINFSSIDDYDKFLTRIVKIRVNHISSLSMTVKDSDKLYQQALTQAISQARQKASIIAKHSEVTLGQLVYLKEISNNHYQPQYSMAMMAEDSSARHRSLTGTNKIKASVIVKFAIN